MRSEIARLVVAQVFLHVPMAGSRMAMALFALAEGYSKTAVGMLVALFTLSPIFISLPAGRYTDRHGLKRPVTLCAALSCGGFLLAAAWPVYPALCAAALISGASVATGSLAMQRQIGKIAQTPEQLKSGFAWISMAPAMAIVIGPAVAGVVIDIAGYRWLFFVMAVSPLITWLLALNARDTADGASSRRRLAAAWDLLKVPGMRQLVAFGMLMAAGWEMHGFMIPVLGHDRGLNASAVGTVLACFAVGVFAVRLVIPFIAARVPEWLLLTLGVALAGLVIMAYPLAPTTLAMCAASTVLGMMLGSVQPMVMSMLHQITPPDRQGEALGIRSVTIYAAAVCAPVLLGAISALAGASGVFWIVGAVLLLGSSVGRSLRRVQKALG